MANKIHFMRLTRVWKPEEGPVDHYFASLDGELYLELHKRPVSTQLARIEEFLSEGPSATLFMKATKQWLINQGFSEYEV